MIILMKKYLLKNINSPQNAYLESIKTSIMGKKLGKCQKHNRQILEHYLAKQNDALPSKYYNKALHMYIPRV